METRKVSEITFRKDLYPRIETSPTTVQKYAEDLSVLPLIEINQHNELIDGWHRWTAHKKENEEDINVIVTQTSSDIHFLELAIERNATHGLQLSQADKKEMARQIYRATPDKERKGKEKYLAKILSVKERSVSRWLQRIKKDAKGKRQKVMLDMWMSCHTQQEIADEVGVGRKTVDDFINSGENGQLSKIAKNPHANYQVDFKPPIYNVWKYKENTPGNNHYGNTNIKILDNLLYLYTNPLDIVIDPFAGGGSTIDICKKRFRRYWVSDRLPIIEREHEIRKHCLTNGLPKVPRWQDVKLVYLDPPYWRQAQGQYSNDKEDLANMSLRNFTNTLLEIILDFNEKLSDAYIALIIQPTQWNANDRKFTDHVSDMIGGLSGTLISLDMRYSVPYESQQCNAQMVNWARENKKCLVLSREIIVWRIN